MNNEQYSATACTLNEHNKKKITNHKDFDAAEFVFFLMSRAWSKINSVIRVCPFTSDPSAEH